MSENITSLEEAYTAIVVVSPMVQGEEKKDQDRARFCGPGQSACVCDGVTSSLNAAQAAEMVTFFSPTLFEGDTTEKLRILCDLLMAQRNESMASDDISVPKGTPDAMRQMLRNVLRNKKAESFQTTIVAAQLNRDQSAVSVKVVRCGDSALFAFSPEGELLTSSLASSLPYKPTPAARAGHRRSPQCSGTMSFGPGTEVLVRIDGPLAVDRHLAQIAGISPEHVGNWIVCTPVDSSHCRKTGGQTASHSHAPLLEDDRLLVPRYLYGKLLTSGEDQYLILRYSSSIRVVSLGQPLRQLEGFGTGGSSTLVLPDHFYSGAFECFQDTFPHRTHFLLCSDGFYGAFSDWPHLYQWLHDNASLLQQDDRRTDLLQQLHTQLNDRKGDDDISFVWAQPKVPPKTSGGQEYVS